MFRSIHSQNYVYFFWVILLISSCENIVQPSKQVLSYNYTFQESSEGWGSFFSDYFIDQNPYGELTRTTLPAPLDTSKLSLRLTAHNSTDDICATIVRQFTNLKPNTEYRVEFSVDFATDILIDGFGVGGSPDLPLGAGALPFQPENIADTANNIFRKNFNSFQGGHESCQFVIIGNIGTSTTYPAEYKIVNRNSDGKELHCQSNAEGRLWIVIGIDSDFEATTIIYFTCIDIKMEEQ